MVRAGALVRAQLRRLASNLDDHRQMRTEEPVVNRGSPQENVVPRKVLARELSQSDRCQVRHDQG